MILRLQTASDQHRIEKRSRSGGLTSMITSPCGILPVLLDAAIALDLLFSP